MRELLLTIQFSISLGIDGIPLVCLGADGYIPRLVFWMIMPLVFAAIACVYGTGRVLKDKDGSEAHEHGSQKRLNPVAASFGLRLAHASLPLVLRIFFLSYPIVTNVAFEAFSCYHFEDADDYLVTDVSIVCGSSKHRKAQGIAWLAIWIYPIGLFVLNLVLLVKVRNTVIDGQQQTSLSKATAFLHREYQPSLFWWELLEMARRFLLVGLFVIGPYHPGSMMQLAIAALTCIIFLLIQAQLMPYTSRLNNYLGLGCSLSLTVLFLTCIFYKISSLTELHELQSRMSYEQQEDYVLPTSPLTFVIILCVLSALALSAVLFAMQFVIEERKRRVFDSRWDRFGFERWARRGAVKFVKLGYLRQLAESWNPVPGAAPPLKTVPESYSELNKETAYLGPPPSFVDIIAAVMIVHRPLDASLVAELINGLSDYDDDDCIFLSPWSLAPPSGDWDEGRTSRIAHHGQLRMHMYYKVRVFILPFDVDPLVTSCLNWEEVEGPKADDAAPPPSRSSQIFGRSSQIFQRESLVRQALTPGETTPRRRAAGKELTNQKLSDALRVKTEFTQAEWDEFGISELPVNTLIRAGSKYFKPILVTQGDAMAKVLLSSYCQRIMNAKDKRLHNALNPERLVDLNGVLDKCHFDSPDHHRRVVSQLNRALKTLQPILLDRDGFAKICAEVQLHWLKVGYIKQLAAKEGPFPRQQDLNSEGVHKGLPPGRMFSLSHGIWCCPLTSIPHLQPTQSIKWRALAPTMSLAPTLTCHPSFSRFPVRLGKRDAPVPERREDEAPRGQA